MTYKGFLSLILLLVPIGCPFSSGCDEGDPFGFIGAIIEVLNTDLDLKDTNEILIAMPERIGIPRSDDDVTLFYRGIPGIPDTCYAINILCIRTNENFSCETILDDPEIDKNNQWAIIRYSHDIDCVDTFTVDIVLEYAGSNYSYGRELLTIHP